MVLKQRGVCLLPLHFVVRIHGENVILSTLAFLATALWPQLVRS